MANAIKIKRYESLILDTINRAICFEVENKTAKKGRVTYVKLTNDLSYCTAYVESIDRQETIAITNALNKLNGFFRSKICAVLDIYKTPKISFEIDKSIDYAQNIDKILKDIKSKE